VNLFELLDNHYNITHSKDRKALISGNVYLIATIESDWSSSLPRTVNLSVKGWTGNDYSPQYFERDLGKALINRQTGEIAEIKPSASTLLNDWDDLMDAWRSA
jgi:hypothetical protein